MKLQSGQQMANKGQSTRHSKTSVTYWESRLYFKTCKRSTGHYEAREYSVRIAHTGKREAFSLNTANKKAAADKAKKIYLSILGKGWEETLRQYKPETLTKPTKAELPTVGMLIELSVSVSTARPVTLNAYVKAFRRIVSDIFEIEKGKKYDGKKGGAALWQESVDKIELDKVTPAKIQQWKIKYLRDRSANPADQAKAIVTVNSLIRNSKGLFSKKVIGFVGDEISLPSPLPFEGITLEKAPSMRYQSKINAAELLNSARDELSGERPEEYKILILGLLCGLRKSEIDHLLWSAFDPDKGVIRLEDTEYHRLKSADSAGSVDLDPELISLFLAFKDRATGEFIIESENAPRRLYETRSYRASKHFDSLAKWLKEHGAESDRPLHELRKEYGSLICHKAGIYAASRALRHSDIRITSQVYVDKKETVTPGLGNLLASGMIGLSEESAQENTSTEATTE